MSHSKYLRDIFFRKLFLRKVGKRFAMAGGLLIVAALLIAALLPPVCIAEPSGSLSKGKMATSWPGGPYLDNCAKPFTEMVKLLTDGRIALQAFNGGVLGDSLQVTDSVVNGVAQFGHHWSGYDWGRDRASVLVGGYAGGPQALEMLHWLYEGGGAELWNKWRMEKFGVEAIPLCVYSTEIFLHSRKPVKSLADFQGLKLRTTGLWMELAKDLGASPVTAAGGDIYPMLERGVIDATEWGTASVNLTSGYHKAVKYVIVPGVHQPVGVFELLINKDVWAQVSPRDKELIQLAARLTTYNFWTNRNKNDLSALRAFREAGNEIIRLDQEVIDQAQKRGLAWAEKEAEANNWVKVFLKSQSEFLELWKDGKLLWDLSSGSEVIRESVKVK